MSEEVEKLADIILPIREGKTWVNWNIAGDIARNIINAGYLPVEEASQDKVEAVAKKVFLMVCGVPDEVDAEWKTCGLNMQQNCLQIADSIFSLLSPEYEEAHLEVLGDEEMVMAVWNAGNKYEAEGGDLDNITQKMRFQWIVQATVAHNEKRLRKIYIRRENGN